MKLFILCLIAAAFEAPVIDKVDRTGSTTVDIEVELPPSEQIELAYFDVSFFNGTTGNRLLDVPVS